MHSKYFRLIGDFAEKCKVDIEGSNCGRVSQQIHSDASDILVQHSQVNSGCQIIVFARLYICVIFKVIYLNYITF